MAWACRTRLSPPGAHGKGRARLPATGRWQGRGRASAGSRPSADDAYQVLGVPRDASGDAEVKRAYRRLLSQHHPDKLVSKGLPEEMMKVAAQKTHEIRQAYERIREARGWLSGSAGLCMLAPGPPGRNRVISVPVDNP